MYIQVTSIVVLTIKTTTHQQDQQQTIGYHTEPASGIYPGRGMWRYMRVSYLIDAWEGHGETEL